MSELTLNQLQWGRPLYRAERRVQLAATHPAAATGLWLQWGRPFYRAERAYFQVRTPKRLFSSYASVSLLQPFFALFLHKSHHIHHSYPLTTKRKNHFASVSRVLLTTSTLAKHNTQQRTYIMIRNPSP